MGTINSHLISSTNCEQPVQQVTGTTGDPRKSNNPQGRLSEPIYTNFWQRMFRKTKSFDSEPVNVISDTSYSPSNKFDVKTCSLEDNVVSVPSVVQGSSGITAAATTTTPIERTVIVTTTPTTRPLSMDSSDLKNNPYKLERRHFSEYGHHQFQITSLSTRKQRLLRNHHHYQQNTSSGTTTHTNDNYVSGSSSSNRNSSPPAIQPISQTGYSLASRRAVSKTDLRNCNLSKRESKSQNYLHLVDSPKMRFVRVMHAFASVPDLTKKPTRSALKGSRNNSTNRLVNEREPLTVSPNPLNSDSFSLTPPTPAEIRHLVHFHSTDIPSTLNTIKPVNKIDLIKSDDSDWSFGQYNSTNENEKLSSDIKIEYSKYSPELKRANESSRRNFSFNSKFEKNTEFSQNQRNLPDLDEISVSQLEESIQEDISYDYEENNELEQENVITDETEIQDNTDSDDDQNVEDTTSTTPRFHSKLLRRDSIDYYLEVNKSHGGFIEYDNFSGVDKHHEKIDESNNHTTKQPDSTETNFNGKDEKNHREESVEETDEGNDEAKVGGSGRDSAIESTRNDHEDDGEDEDYSHKPSLTEVLSPALCAAGYGPVGHLLTRWLPQRNFCELLIGTNENFDTSEDAKWCRRKQLLKELARTSTMYTEDMTHEMFMLRFSEFVEVQELEPCDRSADKPWIRLTPKDKVRL
ncbi:unnamed protein product [Heterobilharzia americana]|nr:unnamed protein product [Heterobilharzia americana]